MITTVEDLISALAKHTKTNEMSDDRKLITEGGNYDAY